MIPIAKTIIDEDEINAVIKVLRCNANLSEMVET
jgi:hypothetical protein